MLGILKKSQKKELEEKIDHQAEVLKKWKAERRNVSQVAREFAGLIGTDSVVTKDKEFVKLGDSKYRQSFLIKNGSNEFVVEIISAKPGGRPIQGWIEIPGNGTIIDSKDAVYLADFLTRCIKRQPLKDTAKSHMEFIEEIKKSKSTQR